MATGRNDFLWCSVVHLHLYLCLHLQRVPVLWNTTCLVPVPKTWCPSSPQDYRPVALTSHIIRTLERLVLEQLRPMVRPFTDPLQFAYQPCLRVEDSIIYLLNRVYTQLDKPASTGESCFLTSPVFSTSTVQLYWVRRWLQCRLRPPLCPGSLIT